MARGLRALWTTALLTVLLGVLALVAVTRGMDLAPIAVRSGSMAPTMPIHTLLLTEQVEPSRVRVGDVITFDPPGAPPRTTHRVIERTLRGERWYFRTKGDANDTADDWRHGTGRPERYLRGVTYGPNDAIRVKWHVPQVGRLADLSSHVTLRRTLFYVPLALLTLNALIMIWTPRGSRATTVT